MADLRTSKKPKHLDTPSKLMFGSPGRKHVASQASSNSTTALRGPSLQPPTYSQLSRGRSVYSQSPPRSPNRSPARRIELIQLSPIKNSRLELQKIYDGKQTTTKRLSIKNLILNNFKSYAGVQVVGPFHSSFSAVVGPNGSGKSNVIDSMLFVFGFRANKMRQGKLSNLIHKSENHENLSFCSVEITFQYVMDDADGNTKVLPDVQELSVMRKVFKNNTSKYYINGKESSYTEVTQFLRNEGIDLDHKRFLILQGEVESIAQMKPKADHEGDDGLLEYLEDIIGTAKYKSQIRDALVEMDTLNDICMEKEIRFELVEKEKRSLEAGKEQALEFIAKEKQLTLLKSKQLQWDINKETKKLAVTLDKISAFTEKLENERNKYGELQKEITDLRELSDNLEEQITKINAEKSQLVKDKLQLQRELVSSEEKLKSLNQKRTKAEKTLQVAEKNIRHCENNIRRLNEAQTEFENSLLELNESLHSERSELDAIKMSLRDKTSSISEEVASLEKELEPWTTKLEAKNSQIKLAESEILIIKESKLKLEQEISQLRKDIESYKDRIENHKKKINKLEKESAAITSFISTAQGECDSAKKKLVDMKQVLTNHRQRMTDARVALSNVENKNKVLGALCRLQKSGRIHGFHGRLGDLGTIDDKYDIAISVACPRLDDIVVETVECAQQCIEHLRKNKLGYARFILLDKLKKFNMAKVTTPENVPRLFDLTTPKNEIFAPALYSVLRDTLVAKDLAQANRVAYGTRRFRVVTLDGKLIDISGTMSGGGDRVVKGLMKSKQRSNDMYTSEEVQRMEAELTDRETNFKIATDTFQEMEAALQKYKDRQPNIDVEISKHKIDIDTLSSELQSKKDTLIELESTAENNQRDNGPLEDIENQLVALNSELVALKDESKVKNEQISELRAQIMKIGGLKLQSQNSKVDSLTQQLQIIVAKQKKNRTELKKNELEMNRASKQKLGAENDINHCEIELSKTNNSHEALQEGLRETEHLIEVIEDKKEQLNQEHETAKKNLDDKAAYVEKFKSEEIEMCTHLEKLKNLEHHIKAEISRTDEELNTLKLRDVEQLLQKLDEHNLPLESLTDRAVTPSNQCIPEMTVEDHDADMNDGEAKLISEDPNSFNDQESMDVDQDASYIGPGLPKLTEAELDNIDIEELALEIAQLKEYMDTAYADIDILEEYALRLAEYKRRKLDLNESVEKREEIRNRYEMLKKSRLEEFMDGFGIISMTVKEIYQMITMGGNAELELVDSLDPFSEGVLFSVMPPKKSWRNISNLSGGEKTLSSLALVFALHKYKPTPLYVMDEIDAALDFRNVSIVANYIKERTKNAQFIVISLRNNMFELAQQLIGIYKSSNMTKSTTLQNIDILNIK
ncbi:condensin subunit SMC4 Ecym_4311 [Eremothecium cymbalariae DBVPG|uniref:Structural maintenance of chromosomes protein n=1 Tax=Eremothecium cymbalariae (strain CBS 270.75 / DBVPG 7215 / KCTC 17166 / NRRL Y-17582) TaxID=931890 RepID=G8JTM1_ERECY|nr:hypothetical protein Ecym_4311 [Eremothecium cymbalariae DBVPG\